MTHEFFMNFIFFVFMCIHVYSCLKKLLSIDVVLSIFSFCNVTACWFQRLCAG